MGTVILADIGGHGKPPLTPGGPETRRPRSYFAENRKMVADR
jgi:hypothetical protein